ncbi:MAG: MaoC/PaaZ C-terminal domain-containing protein [Myxococcota bacterium]|nr:MaoC/PaaZ C-terminal domain-containing protein [Myxococcota bacterium]MDW8362692.1 MaoC/PaaZ C-terminal domain-containing protein [Myxococcales bacterium]
MPLEVQSVGRTVGPRPYEPRWQDVVLYALGVGARRDELEFLYEKHGPKILPTFAVVPAYPVVEELFGLVGGNPLGLVHGGQSVRVHRLARPQGRWLTTGRVEGVYDLRRLATAVLSTRTEDDTGTLLFETTWTLVYRFDGGFGGPPPPRRTRLLPPDRSPRWRRIERTVEEQALLYRLSGDLNPLHADPEVARAAGFEAPILHGLCTFGFVGRAVLRAACDGDPERLVALHADFSRPVVPGQTLVVEGWDPDDGRIALRVSVEERPQEPVLTNVWAEVR